MTSTTLESLALPVFPAPPTSPANAPFWEATAAGKLLIKRCEACGKSYFYPRPLCPFCASERTAWVQASGRGEIYTLTTVKKWDVKAAIAFVQLEEGPRVQALVADADPASLRIGDKVVAQFVPAENDLKVFIFTRA